MRFRLSFTFLSILVAGAALGQSPEETAAAQYPAPTNVFELDAGAAFRFSGSRSSVGYYRLTYKGSLVRSAGTPFQFARGLDPLQPPAKNQGGDTPALSFRFEDNATMLGGGLFDTLGIAPLRLAGLENFDLRGSFFAGSDLEGRRLQVSGGVETAPYRLPFLARSGASNWIVFGVHGQRQEATDTSGGDANFGILTARSFVGKAFGWRKSAEVGATAAKLEAEVLAAAPTYEMALAKKQPVSKAAANSRTPVQQLFLDAVDEAEPAANETEAERDARWRRVVRELAAGDADAITDQPTLALYGEASGWLTFAGTPGGDRVKGLFTATLDYWFLPRRDDVFVRLRYENGFERATPNERKNHLMVSLALRF